MCTVRLGESSRRLREDGEKCHESGAGGHTYAPTSMRACSLRPPYTIVTIIIFSHTIYVVNYLIYGIH